MSDQVLADHQGTMAGMILGTAAYMSPEQARGRVVDRRADIWAFGVVLYEMLAGRRAFEGEDVSITLASVLKEDVNWKALPEDLPASWRRLLRRCLEKDPKRRLSAIADARLDLDEAGAPGADAGTGSAAKDAERTAELVAAQRRQVSRQGGGQAMWRGDGRELFYLTAEGKMMSVRATPTAAGGLEMSPPAELFQTPLAAPRLIRDEYSVTADGQRFLILRPRGSGAATATLRVVVNWRGR